MTRAKLADKLCSDCPTVTGYEVYRWETGRRVPREPWLDRIATVLTLPDDVLAAIVSARERDPRKAWPKLAVRVPPEPPRVINLPADRWTPLPQCEWYARPRSRTSALLDSRPPARGNVLKGPVQPIGPRPNSGICDPGSSVNADLLATIVTTVHTGDVTSGSADWKDGL